MSQSKLEPARTQVCQKPRVIRASLTSTMETNILYALVNTFDSYDNPEDMCTALKRFLDSQYGLTWHVVIGDYFGSHFEHDQKSFCYITYKGLSFLMFKFG